MHLLRAVAGRDPGPRRGVGVHPLAGRGARQQLQERRRGRARSARPSRCRPRRPAPRAGSGTSGRCPRTRRRRGCRSRRPRSWRRRRATLARRNFSRRCSRAAAGQRGRVVGQVVGGRAARRRPSGGGRSRGSRRGCGGSPAPGCGEGRSSPSCTISSARSVSQAAMPSACERLVEADLLGGHRLDLDHLVDAVVAGDLRRRSRRPRRRRGPSARSRRAAVSDASSCSRWVGEVAQRGVLDRRAGERAAPPSPRPRRPPRPACRGSCAVAWARLWRSWVSPSAARAASGNAGIPTKVPVMPVTCPGATAVVGAVLGASVAARISARCITRTPARCRESSPPMCIRQELSPATSTSAPVSRDVARLVGAHRHRGVGVLHRERAAEAAALLGLRQVDQASARAPARAAAAGRSPTPSIRSEWQVGW